MNSKYLKKTIALQLLPYIISLHIVDCHEKMAVFLVILILFILFLYIAYKTRLIYALVYKVSNSHSRK
jgi:hypothetical protein